MREVGREVVRADRSEVYGDRESKSRTYSFLVGPGEVLMFFFVDEEVEDEIR